jgi:glycine dehydrogenase subunit 1
MEEEWPIHLIPNYHLKAQMLNEIGLESIDQLFEDVPSEIQIDGLKLPQGMAEHDLREFMAALADKNEPVNKRLSFLGGGLYHHSIPSVVRAVLSRSEFYSAYTPYQAEISQGMLQAAFEYQSLIAELTAMDAVNTSMYDGTTALAEAILMARRATRKSEFILPSNLHRDTYSIIENYIKWTGMKIKKVSYKSDTGTMDLNELKNNITDDTAGVYIENPNFFGVFEPGVLELRELLGDKIMMVVGIKLLSLGLVRSPGDYGADIVVGDAQPFGNPINFGGPSVGIFATKKEHIRRMPGRIIGLTKDAEGKRAFCMTLQTREQHIRRDKATSNICTNQTLCAVASAVHIAALGKNGFVTFAEQNASKSKQLARRLNEIEGFKAPKFNSHHFNEFVLDCPIEVNDLNEKLYERGIQGGLVLKDHFPELGNAMLVAVTEMHNDADFQRLASNLEDITGSGGDK